MPSITAAMNLFIQGASTPIEESLDLVIDGCPAGTSGAFTSVPLFIEGGVGDLSGALPLFISGPSSGLQTAEFPLYVGGTYHLAENSLPLFIQNVGATGFLPLFIRGSGSTAGALPYHAGMPLYIERWPAEAIPLYIFAATTITSGLDLSVTGGNTQTGNMDLYISGVGSLDSSLKLYTRGH